MYDFHSYFGYAKEDPISIVNVALSGPQANRLFERFTNRLLSNKWFKRFKIIQQNKTVPDSGSEYSDELIQITGSKVVFPQNLEAIRKTVR